MKPRFRLNVLVASVALATFLNTHAAQDRPPEQTNPLSATNQTNRSDMQLMQHMPEMDTIKKRDHFQLLDVRRDDEWNKGFIPGAKHIFAPYLPGHVAAKRPCQSAGRAGP
jgi:hypothetical protein